MSLPMMLAVIPPLYLLWKVYRQDKIEKEPFGLIVKLFILGCISTIPAAFVEEILGSAIGSVINPNTLTYGLIENFLGVAIVEEYFKYVMLKHGSWKNEAFNYKFDAVVYAVSVSIGFATLENILYVEQMGLEVAILRAFTAIPGHTIFAIFMGVYYGMAKLYEHDGHPILSRSCRVKAVIVPTLIHGFYDFTASYGGIFVIMFYVFLIAIEILAIKTIRRESREDQIL